MKPKPDPEGILFVLNTLNVNANEAILLGIVMLTYLLENKQMYERLAYNGYQTINLLHLLCNQMILLRKQMILVSLNTRFSK